MKPTRLRAGRRSALSAWLFLVAALTPAPLSAHDHPAYWNPDIVQCPWQHAWYLANGSPFPPRPDWMANVPDNLRLTELCLPGTHDTMSRYGSIPTETQELTLIEQLEAGIRVIDIRCRQDDDFFRIYHGRVPQLAVFGADVLDVLAGFLADHPTETVLMHLKQEGSELSGSPSLSFNQVLDNYLNAYSDIHYLPSVADYPDHGTELGEVRGKFVIIDGRTSDGTFGFPSSRAEYWDRWDCRAGEPPVGAGAATDWTTDDDPLFFRQANYCLDAPWDLHDKWMSAKTFIQHSTDAEVTGLWGPGHFYENSLSGSGTIAINAPPYFVASGHIYPCSESPRLFTGCTDPSYDVTGLLCENNMWPDFPRTTCLDVLDPLGIGWGPSYTVCAISYEGTNVLAYEYISAKVAAGERVFTGIVFADFPGPGLIEKIISLNPNPIDPYVTSLADDGPGSLRFVVENCWPESHITFDPSLSGGTITLATELTIDKSVTIDATKLPGGLTIEGGGLYSTLQILPDRKTSVTLLGLEISDSTGLSALWVSTYTLEGPVPATLTMRDCTLSNNPGNGIDASAEGAKVTLENVTIHNNGGHAVYGAKLHMENCTVSENAYGVTAGDGSYLAHCTIVGNNQVGLSCDDDVLLRNSIVAGNGFPWDTYSDLEIVGANLTILGSVLIGDNRQIEAEFPAGAPNVNGHYVNVDPELAPLGDYGGSGWTMPPRLSSYAVNGASLVSVTVLDEAFPDAEDSSALVISLDQRGQPRPDESDPDPTAIHGTNADLGAVELQARVQNLSTFSTYPSIQSAINAASSGDEIVVSDGLYTESLDLGSQPITVRSTRGADATVIDAQGASHVVQCVNGQGLDTVFQGFTLTGGDAGGGNGGGMLITGSDPTVIDCRFDSNQASLGGGVYTDSSPSLVRCSFVDNDATTGGGLYCDGASSAPDIQRTIFAGNSATQSGGLCSAGAAPTLVNCLFHGNVVSNGGAGFAGDNVSAINCTFADNDNTSGGSGGAIVPFGGTTIENCIVWGNSPDGIWSPTPLAVTVRYSQLQESWTGAGEANDVADPLFVDPDGADDNLTTLSDNNYRLGDGSPATDAGDNDALPFGVTSDLDGAARVLDDPAVVDSGFPPTDSLFVDRGAYEFQPDALSVGPTGFPTIQAAIDVAQSGATIEVAPGTYVEAINFLGKNITVRSTDGPEVTIIDGNGADSVVLIVNGEGPEALLEGFTITGGDNQTFGGGGMRISESSPTIRHCAFRENSGRGLSIDTDSHPEIYDCVFIANTANGSGGGVGVFPGTPSTTTASSAIFVRCSFLGNISGDNGGGLFTAFGSVSVIGCLFSGNEATPAGGDGGGAYIDAPATESATVSNCTFVANQRAGLWIDGPSVVANSIFWGNENDFAAASQIETWAGFGTSGDPELRFNNFEPNPSAPIGIPPTLNFVIGAGNLAVDPLFVDADGADDEYGTEDDNLRLSIGSPSADAGNNSDVFAGITDDLDGEPRFADDVAAADFGSPPGQAPYVDMGPYESQYADALTIHVPGSVPNLQLAIDVVESGGEILVAPGTYAGPIDFGGKALTLRSTGGAAVTIIDRGGTGRVIHCTSGEGADTILEGFTITGGDAATETNNWGGGLLILGSEPTIQDCRFQNNMASNGGAIYTDSSPRILRCVFDQNTALAIGGGVSCEGLSSTPDVRDCVFTGNSAVIGGGVGHVNGSPTVSNTLFAGNNGNTGGGLGGKAFAVNCTFVDNTAGSGSGVYTVAEAEFHNCIFWNNDVQAFGGVAAVVVSYSIVQGGWSGAGGFNLDADPLFLDPDGPDGDPATLEDNDYRLSGTSPGIDAGNTGLLTTTGATTDLAGEPRYFDDPSVPDSGVALPGYGVVDLGAFEYQGALVDQMAVVVAEFGTYAVGDDASLSILSNGLWVEGDGDDAIQTDGSGVVGGGEAQRSDAEALWHRSSDTPIFVESVDASIGWYSGGSFFSGVFEPGTALGGAVQGTDNWMKVVSDVDGVVSWAQFEFDFNQPELSPAPVLVAIPIYVTRYDGGDFSLAEAMLAVAKAQESCPGLPARSGRTYEQTLVGATADGVESCTGTSNADHWWSYTAESDGILNVTTCGTHDLPGIDLGMDTVLSVHSDCATELACNDDTLACVGDDVGQVRDSSISLSVVAGQTLFVRVSHYPGTAPGDYQVHFDLSDCNPITGLTCSDGGGTAELGWSLNDTYDSIEVRRNGTVIDTIAGDATSYSDTPPFPGGHVYGVEGICTSGNSGVIACWIAVSASGPPNDDCANAIGVSDGTFFGTNAFATNDSTATCGSSSSSPDVWYEYTATSDGMVRINTCGTNDGPGVDAGIDTVLAVYASCGGAELDCNDDWPAGSDPIGCSGADVGLPRDSAVDLPVSMGDVILIRVATFGATPTGEFQLNVETTPDAPTCATCVGLRGDVNADTDVNIADPVALLSYLFTAGDPPVGCLAVGDANADGGTNIADAVYLLDYLFVAGPTPAAPGYPSADCLDLP